MRNILKFLLLVVLLNVIRYAIGGPIESLTIMDKMHQPMFDFRECFNSDFKTMDWVTSFFYNFMMWLCTAWIFYIVHRSVSGSYIIKSLKIYGIMCLFFISITAVYMNHYVDGIKTFYHYAILDALITFTIVGIANGLLFPIFFNNEINKTSGNSPA